MKHFVNHWERGHWPSSGSVLHWYIVPPAAVHLATTTVQSLVDQPGLRAVPSAWLHCTVVQLGLTSSLDESKHADLFDAGVSSVRDLRAFTVSGRATFGPQACTWHLEPTEELTEVFRRVVQAARPFFPDLRTNTYSPHISFAYSHSEADATETIEALATADRLEPFEVHGVQLLEVFREPGPQHGWYSWTVLGEARFMGSLARN